MGQDRLENFHAARPGARTCFPGAKTRSRYAAYSLRTPENAGATSAMKRAISSLT
jgi:hypothetical protein